MKPNEVAAKIRAQIESSGLSPEEYARAFSALTPEQIRKATGTPPSIEFMNAFTCCGTPVATCGFCGRTIFGSGRDMDEGEIETLRLSAKTDPDRYVEDSQSDSIAVGEINGVLLVWGCPCNKARKYEDFIWSHRLTILDYLKRRTASDLERAQQTADAIENLTSGVK